MTDRASRDWLAGTVLLLLPALVYLPLRSAGFVWDDDSYVTQNQNLGSLAGLARIWLDPRSLPQYYPLVHTTYWFEHALWGLSAAGFHATNVLLHGVSAILLWRVLVALAVPGAFLAAAIFATHPVMVESVAWITERKNVLSMALALASLLAYLRFRLPEREPAPRIARRLHALSLALYVGALLSKTVVCSLPAVLAVLIWWKRGRIERRDWLALLPFFAFGAVAGASTVWLERHHVGAIGVEWSLGPLERVLLAGRALWFYVGKLLWPHPLIFFYPRWHVTAAEAWQLSFPIAALLVVAALWGLRERIGRGPLDAVLIFAGVLFPALGFFDVYPFRYSFVADHFQYHASAALIALFAAGCATAAARRGGNAARAAELAALALVAGLGLLTWRQAHVYRDLETLYRDTIAKNDDAWNAHLNLANLLSSQGRNAEALPFARNAARVAPAIADAHNTLGGVLFLLSAQTAGASQARDEAIAEFARVLALEPDHEDALYNGAVALTAAGRHEEAARYYARILELDPAALDAKVGLGRALLLLGRPAEAEAPLRDALRQAPASKDLRQLVDEAARRRNAMP